MIKCEISGFKTKIVNKLRRVIMGELATIAIDKIQIFINDTTTLDEIVAHKLGLIPIRIINTEILKCQDCSIEFKLDVTCNKGSTYIMSDNIKTSNKDVELISGVAILPITEGQRVRLLGTARLGNGSEHAKFNPITICSFTEKENGTFIFELESRGQLEAEVILGFGIKLVEEMKDVIIF